MNSVFVDTSGLVAVIVANDREHSLARRQFELLMTKAATLVTTSYVLIETYAILGRRFGLEAVESFRRDFEPLLEIVWIDARRHEAGLDRLAAENDPSLSLVDAVSFGVMRDEAIHDVFAFDRHFARQRFRVVP